MTLSDRRAASIAQIAADLASGPPAAALVIIDAVLPLAGDDAKPAIIAARIQAMKGKRP